jgi:SAM-dependent methyltransferase
MSSQNHSPSPKLFMAAIQAYQRTAALKAALDLDLFTTIGTSQLTARELATRCETSERGMRIFCDYLVASGFLLKDEHAYALTADSDTFLNRHSPAYLGVVAGFLLSPQWTDSFKDVAAAVRKGGTVLPHEGTIAPEHPIWVDFARSMMPLMALPAQVLVKRIDPDANAALKVLEIAAGHGIFGITLATHNPHANVVALDWPNVLEVATANAKVAGISERYRTIAGSAFDVEYGQGYDLILLTNFLHHFDPPTCKYLLQRVYTALADGGRVVAVDWILNDDQVSPPDAAKQNLDMLVSTPSGEVYTFADFEGMFHQTGFGRSELVPLPPSIFSAIISYKQSRLKTTHLRR